MIPYLLVYGTLMRRAAVAHMGHAERQRLEVQGDWLGAAQIAGRLFDLGQYPVLDAPKPPDEKSHRETVHGEVFRLHAPQVTVRWLDLYEGIPPGQESGNDYARVLRPVRLATGEVLEAWVYVLAGDADAAPLIPDGRWLPH